MKPWFGAFVPYMRRMPYCEAVDKLVGAVRFAKPEDGLEALLLQTDAWLGRSDVPSILKASIGAELVGALKELSPASAGGQLDASQEALETTKDSIHWLCTGHPKYAAAARQAEEAAASAKSAIAGWLSNRQWRAIDRAALLRYPRWFSGASLESASIDRKMDEATRELWVVREVAGKPRILILAEMGRDGNMRVNISPEPG